MLRCFELDYNFEPVSKYFAVCDFLWYLRVYFMEKLLFNAILNKIGLFLLLL